jgi:cytochrome c
MIRRYFVGFASVATVAILAALTLAGTAVADERQESDVTPNAARAPEGDVAAGREVFRRQCAVCHAAEADVHKAGPSLAGVFGRRAGSTSFPRYRGLDGADFIWTALSLEAYLADPRAFIISHTEKPTTSMTFRVPDERQRRDVIAFLQTLK